MNAKAFVYTLSVFTGAFFEGFNEKIIKLFYKIRNCFVGKLGVVYNGFIYAV